MKKTTVSNIIMTRCRICLSYVYHKKFLYPLFDDADIPTYGEMLKNCANVKVLSGDGLPDKICCICSKTLKSAYKLQKTAEKSDAVLRGNIHLLNISTDKICNEVGEKTAGKKMSFNSITDIKRELDALKVEPPTNKPVIEMKILEEPIASNYSNPEALNGQDIVICNTVIRKIERSKPADLNMENPNDIEADFLLDDFDDDIHDEDYLPPEEGKNAEKVKQPEKAKHPEQSKFKISTLEDVRAYMKKKNESSKKLKTPKDDKNVTIEGIQTSSYITYYPLLENGEKGPPALLRRPGVIRRQSKQYAPRQYKVIDIKPPIPSSKPREKDCCPYCGVLTFTLRKHMYTHAEKKPFQCEQCSQSFIDKRCLDVHVKKHNGVKDIICDICGAKFYSKKNILRHMLIHEGDKKFSCTHCPKTFLLRAMLTRHLQVHTGYKPFKCTECLMSFSQNHHLQTHMIIHTGARAFSCKVCNVKFGYKVNLNNHATRAHGIDLKYKSIHTLTEEVLERQARLQAKALLKMALQLQPQPIPDDEIMTEIIFDMESQ